MKAHRQNRNTGCLIAFGGFSGAGKSTLGRALAEEFDVTIVEIDYVWKCELGIAPTEKPPPGSYTPERHKKVLAEYDRLCAEALKKGRTVVAQRIFSKPGERQHIEEQARMCRAQFFGFWLEAPLETLKKRVRERVNDVSDTTEAVVDRQATFDLGEITWKKIDTHRDPKIVAADVIKTVKEGGYLRD